MMLRDDAYVRLAPDSPMCRVLNGMWQVSGAHGPIDRRAAVSSMLAYHDAGLTTWDLADHYGPAEDFIGAFRRALAADRGEAALAEMQAFTKWVPPPEHMTRQRVEDAIAISRRRMGMDCLSLLQFHTWDYEHPGYLDALAYLTELRDAGQIRHLAVTNFDTEHLALILERGIRIVSNQVQYSLIDRRPEVQMAAFCQAHGVQLLTYGTLCGGLLTDCYLGQPEPPRATLTTASLGKYKPMIDAWGGWSLFQELLQTLRRIGDRYSASIATVAVRAILDRPAVAGVIVGARLGVAEHIADTVRIFSLRLSSEDHAAIDAVLERAGDLYCRIGDCGAEYRR